MVKFVLAAIFFAVSAIVYFVNNTVVANNPTFQEGLDLLLSIAFIGCSVYFFVKHEGVKKEHEL
jgi:hypothetical protein